AGGLSLGTAKNSGGSPAASKGGSSRPALGSMVASKGSGGQAATAKIGAAKSSGQNRPAGAGPTKTPQTSVKSNVGTANRGQTTSTGNTAATHVAGVAKSQQAQQPRVMTNSRSGGGNAAHVARAKPATQSQFVGRRR